MKEDYIIRDQEKIHFINATVVITRKSHKDIKVYYYRVSSANNYVNNEGLIEVKIVDNPVIDVLKKSSITKYNQY